jgi:hypothetical protein
LVTTSVTHSPAWLAASRQVRGELCRSKFVTASRKTVASTVSTFSSRAPQSISMSAMIPAAASRDAAEPASATSDMAR